MYVLRNKFSKKPSWLVSNHFGSLTLRRIVGGLVATCFAEKTFKKTEQKIKLFIDLGYTKTVKDNKEFLFRVITKSHPWGYEKKDNSNTLDADKIRKALDDYQLENHLDQSMELFFPYDALLPVPFSFLINASSFDVIIKDIKSWNLFEKVKAHFLKQNEQYSSENFDIFLIQLTKNKN